MRLHPGSTDRILAWRRLSLRARLVVLVVASLVPLILFTLGRRYADYQDSVSASGQQTLELTRAVTSAVENELRARIAALQVLARSRQLREGNLVGFRAQAEVVIAEQFPGANILLAREDGQQVMNTLVAPGAALPVSPYLDTIREVFATGRPAMTDLYRRALGGTPAVAVVVPVRGADDRVVYVLASVPPLAVFADVINRARVPDGWVMSILDRQGVSVARNLSPERFIGEKASPALLEHMMGEREGTFSGSSLEGIRLVSAFSHSERFGWAVAAGVPLTSLSQPAERAATRALTAGGVALAIGLVLALVLARQITGPMSALRRYAANAIRDEALEPLPTGLREADEVMAALRAAEHDRRAARSFSDRVFETSRDLILVVDRQGNFLQVSPSSEPLLGYRPDEMIGRNAIDFIFPEDLESTRQFMRRARREGLQSQFETRYVHKDGRLVALSWTGAWVAQEERHYFIGRDMTARLEAEQKIRAHLERLNLLHQITRAIGERQDLASIFQVVVRSLEDQLPVDFACLCLYDSVGQTLRVARVGAKSGPLALELAMPEQANVAIDENGLSRCVRGELVYEPDIGAVAHPFPRRLAQGGLRSLVVAPLQSESQVFGVLVAARLQPRSFSSGECEFLRQLSEHVALAAHQAQLYEALQRAYDDLRQTQQTMMQQERLRALGQMASGIAHDVNNALAPVSLYLDSLLETETDLKPESRKFLETIQRATDDVAHTIGRMREFYRQREPQLDLKPVALNELVPQVIDLTRARWSDMPMQRGAVVEMRTELAVDLPLIMGAESELREALINLILNAVDALTEGGTITLRTRAATGPGGSSIHVEVTDTGIGMDEETRRRCLEPFFTTKGERGTGLGLAMVYGVVQRHGADLEIDSAPGRGTTVRLSFPLAAPSATRAETAIPPARFRRLRVLLVDDDPLVLRSLRDILEKDGHMVVLATDGQSGIDRFRAGPARGEAFDAVITDLGMPGIDGRKVASAVKETSPSTPVILLTGWGQRLLSDGGIPPHVDRVLSKPPRLRELRDALAQTCP
ncbi:MAG TPA: ATP-binding protein [Stellaceae bacterium]|nr:ATP-binding protein [Stellaceae bacterium]